MLKTVLAKQASKIKQSFPSTSFSLHDESDIFIILYFGKLRWKVSRR